MNINYLVTDSLTTCEWVVVIHINNGWLKSVISSDENSASPVLAALSYATL